MRLRHSEWSANNHVKANHDKYHLLMSTLIAISIKLKDYNNK